MLALKGPTTLRFASGQRSCKSFPQGLGAKQGERLISIKSLTVQ